jgi:hypothetical protein
LGQQFGFVPAMVKEAQFLAQLEKKKSRSAIKLSGQYPGRLTNHSENGVENMFAVCCLESTLLPENVPCEWV